MSGDRRASKLLDDAAGLDPGRRLSGLALPPEVVMAHQRKRALAALAEAVSEHGYCATKVRHVIGPARISRRTFYLLFAGKDDAFCEAHEEALAELGARVDGACEREPSWPQGVAAAIASVLEWAAEKPCRALLVGGDLLTAGPRLGYCHDRLVARFAPSLLAGTKDAAGAPSSDQTELVIGGVAGVVAARLRAGEGSTLPGLAPQLTHLILLLGHKRAIP